MYIKKSREIRERERGRENGELREMEKCREWSGEGAELGLKNQGHFCNFASKTDFFFYLILSYAENPENELVNYKTSMKLL